MRTFFDYIFYKFYQWYELLNKSYHRLNIDWEEDSIWSATLSISLLQGILIDSLFIFVIGILKHAKFVVSLTEYMVNAGLLYYFQIIISLFPIGVCYLLNRIYYIDKGNFKAALSYWNKRKQSGIWAILFFISCFFLIYMAMNFCKSS